MKERRYDILMNGVVAENMLLEDAVILMKALAAEYYNSMDFGAEIILRIHKDKDEDDLLQKVTASLKRYRTQVATDINI